MKFNVDEIWLDRSGCPYLIIEIRDGNYPIKAQDLKSDSIMMFTKMGNEISDLIESDCDLVTFKGQKEKYPEYIL